MIKYEIYVPGITDDDFDITLKINANSWIEALKIGLNRLGEDAKIIKNLMIDIMDDNSIHVTETINNRVFRIKELFDIEEKKEERPVIEAKPVEAAVTQNIEPIQKPVIEAKPVEAAGTQNIEPIQKPVIEAGGRSNATPVADVALQHPPKEERPVIEAKPVEKNIPLKNRFESHFDIDIEDEVKVKTNTTQKIKLGREITEKKIDVEDILSDLYFDIADIDRENNVLSAMEIVMDLTMKYMDSESGSVYLVDLNKNDIVFAAIRGPKAEELKKLNIRIPMGMGIVGFSVEENVSIAISEVNRDPRFYRAISQKLGYPTYSILSIPIYKKGRVYGAIQLINKKSSSKFTSEEISVIDYIANHAADYLERKYNKF
jgi:putative methionine-R-sulfoxide reductase with GAF domain